MSASTTTASALALDGVSIDVDGRPLVSDLTLSLEPGSRTSVIGPNGSGKTTLLRALAGLHPLRSGSLRRPDEHPGMHFQDGALWPHMTVAEHLAFVDVDDDHAWRAALLARFELEGLARAKPDHMSGGERVRLGLARTFAARPSWVLLDEPLSHLDAATQARMRSLLPALVAELGCTSLTVTHDADDVALFGTQVLSLSGDGGWWLGDADEALAAPPTASLAAFAGRGTLLRGRTDAGGSVDFGHGLVVRSAPADAEVVALLMASDVVVTAAPVGNGRYVAPDGRGGCWVQLGDHLLRSATDPRDLVRDASVDVSATAPPRLLESNR